MYIIPADNVQYRPVMTSYIKRVMSWDFLPAQKYLGSAGDNYNANGDVFSEYICRN